MNVAMIISGCLLCGSFACGNGLIKSAFLGAAHSPSQQFDVSRRQAELMPIVGVNSSVNSKEHRISEVIVFCSAGSPVGQDVTEDGEEETEHDAYKEAHNTPDECGREVVQLLALFAVGSIVGMGIVVLYLRVADS